MDYTARQIAGILGGTVEGDPEVRISTFARIEGGKPGAICFFANPKYENYVYTSKASAIIVNNDFAPRQDVAATMIRVENAYSAVATLLDHVTKEKRSCRRHRGIFCFVHPLARLGRKVYVGSFAYIGSRARIGEGTKICEHVYVGPGTTIGSHCILHPGVRIYPGMEIGDNVILHAGAVIGADGFGFAPAPDGSYKKIEHTGKVIIEDDVEIGANSCVDRSQMEATVIHRGVKIDNLCQVAHNVEIGENTVLCGQVGVAGSTKIGKQCVLAGQVGVAGHLTVADRTTLGAKTGVIGTIKEEGQAYMGCPALPHKEFLRSYVAFRRNGREKQK